MYEFFYRFRPMASLLGKFQELEKQQIYFAAPSELNDPMEGFKDIVWQGDAIVWTNLFRHFVRSLNRALTLALLSGEDKEIDWQSVSTADLRPAYARAKEEEALDDSIFSDFLSDPINELIQALARRTTPVRRNELATYLRGVHAFAIAAIQKRLGMGGAESHSPGAAVPAELVMPKLAELSRQAEAAALQGTGESASIMFQSMAHIGWQASFIGSYADENRREMKNLAFVLFEFQDTYVDHIERLMYPDWYAACFMSDCRNASLWGYYGQNHQGACLVFKPEPLGDRQALSLKTERFVGNGPVVVKMPIDFKQVAYARKHVKVDFFRSLGKLPTPTLSRDWYCDSLGNRSICAGDVFSDEDKWRAGYWQQFEASIATKLEDWRHENEFRLVIQPSMFFEGKSRALEYDFQSLAGIIFGIKTSPEDKMRICKIIEAKCKSSGRSDFKFFQAYFSPRDGSIEYQELALLRFDRA